jgi:hypothetical protein
MYNLIIAVLSIALTALVVSGGASYMSPEWGNRRMTTDLATLSYRSFDAAVSAYRAANGGSLPPIASAAPAGLGANELPWPVLRPYLGARADVGSNVVSLSPVTGMEWYYATDSTSVALCLVSLGGDGREPIPSSVRSGLQKSTERASVAFVGRSCLNRDDSAVSDQGPFAVTYRIQSGS